jgi:excisionase family DNA binding protein
MGLEDAIKKLTIEIINLNGNLMKNRVSSSSIVSETLTVPEFCKITNISKSMFYKLIKQGCDLKIMKIGSRTLISRDELDRWIKNR